MFRSLSYDHPQGSSFVLSALPLPRCLLRHLHYSTSSRPDNPQTGTPGTHTDIDTYSHIPNNANGEAKEAENW
jgi:hypothetical protein